MTRALLSLLLMSACGPALPRGSATLDGVAPGQPVSLGEVGAWAQASDTFTVVLDRSSTTAQLSCRLDGVDLGCFRPPGAALTATSAWPRTKLGAERATFAVLVDGAELARWPVSRTVIDEELSVCVANTEGEDEGLPLDRCKALQPFGDRALPLASGDAVVFRRVKFSLGRGTTNLSRVSLVSHNDAETRAPGLLANALGLFVKNFALVGPGEVEFLVDTQANLSAGEGQPLSWQTPRLRNRVFTDLDPNRLPVRVRVGARAELSRSLQATDAQALVAWRDESGMVSLADLLPLQLLAGVPTGFTVRLAPSALGAHSIWPRLTLKDGAGERTDRIPFRFEGIAATRCKLEFADVNLGMVLVGETRLARFAVKNVSDDGCSGLRVKRTPEWVQLETRPIPAPGQTVEWTARVSPTNPGLIVGLIEVDGDDQAPTFADFSFRLEANVSR